MQTLEKIAPTPLRLDIAGERLSILPIKTRELPGMMKAVAPIMSELGAVFNLSDNEEDCDDESSVDTGALLKLFSTNADSIITAVAIGCRKPREWVDDLDIDDLIAAAAAVVESNADFFVQRALPALTKAVGGANKEVGQTQSTDSLAQATE